MNDVLEITKNTLIFNHEDLKFYVSAAYQNLKAKGVEPKDTQEAILLFYEEVNRLAKRTVLERYDKN